MSLTSGLNGAGSFRKESQFIPKRIHIQEENSLKGYGVLFIIQINKAIQENMQNKRNAP